MTPEYIVVHTAAADIENVDAETIDRWHKERGWQGIGYHYVVIGSEHSKYPDGMLQTGRAENRQGAHALGMNDRSIGICCVGHGDRWPFTGRQMLTLTYLCARLCIQYGIQSSNVIGHREIGAFGGWARGKTCPGRRVDMKYIRHRVARAMSGWDGSDLRGHVE
jgi:hypothetical protein